MLVTAREMLTNSRRQILRYLASHWIGRWQVVSVSAAQGCHENDGSNEMPTDQHLVNPQTLALTEQRTRTYTHTHAPTTDASLSISRHFDSRRPRPPILYPSSRALSRSLTNIIATFVAKQLLPYTPVAHCRRPLPRASHLHAITRNPL
jgi:hypothetical protein